MRLRSLLFVPGDRPERMENALHANADALILDLEDSVSPQRKVEARDHVLTFLNRCPRTLPLFVRINPERSGLLELDLAAILEGRPDALVLPKAEGAASIRRLDELLTAAVAVPPRILPIATETPAAVFRLADYLVFRERLAGITWGAEDLCAAVGAESPRLPDGSFTPPYELVRSLTLFAAHAAQVAAIDTVYPAFRDHEGLTRYAGRGARDGFSGMLAIHPVQVPIINAAFTPSPDVIDRARRIVAEFARQPDAGVLNIDGAMVDKPHLLQAQLILARCGPASMARSDTADSAD